jgi:hypothetical protein
MVGEDVLAGKIVGDSGEEVVFRVGDESTTASHGHLTSRLEQRWCG